MVKYRIRVSYLNKDLLSMHLISSLLYTYQNSSPLQSSNYFHHLKIHSDSYCCHTLMIQYSHCPDHSLPLLHSKERHEHNNSSLLMEIHCILYLAPQKCLAAVLRLPIVLCTSINHGETCCINEVAIV